MEVEEEGLGDNDMPPLGDDDDYGMEAGAGAGEKGSLEATAVEPNLPVSGRACC
jgi:hypothetical protein